MMRFSAGASGRRIFGKMTWAGLLLALSGCGFGSTIGGVAGSVAGGAVDIVLRAEGGPADLGGLP